VIGLSGPFRGSRAVAAGLLTWNVLRGPRFRRLFPDVYVPADLECDLAVRSRAAAVLVHPRGVLAGYSAAELLGASCGPADAPAEVLLLAAGCQSYHCPGLRVHRDLVDLPETTRAGCVRLTTPVRTAFDLARWAPGLTEKVVALDALAHVHRFAPADVLETKQNHPGAYWSRALPEVVRLANARSESPMESRIRLALVLAGLPAPTPQHEVTADGRDYRLDLAYPSVRLAVEYDGDLHRTQERAHRDLVREAALVRLGWRILRFDAATVLNHPWRVAALTRAELDRRSQ
jgi:hypothetical protein